MAELNNISGDTKIIINLRKTKESPEWVGYDLKVSVKENSEFKDFLQLSYSECLYFDNFTEPEVPALSNSLCLIVYEAIEYYYFTPIDEKDFFLTFERKNDYYIVHLFTDSAVIFNSHEWKSRSEIGLRLWTNKENILSFSRQLIKEYDDMFLPKLLTTGK